MRIVYSIFTLALVLFLGYPAHSSEPPSEPILRIESGMHTAVIRRIGVDTAQRFLVTSSDDKTVRVWELSTGRLIKTLRPPIGAGNEGKLYSAAISPDGRTIAAAGYTGWDWERMAYIYLFDRETGSFINRIAGLPGAIQHLAFSDDSRYFAASLERNGVRIYRMEDLRLVAEDKEYGDRSLWADFDGSGRLVTASYDGYIRLYDSSLRLISMRKAPGGNRPFSATFSPDGKKVAVGFDDSTSVDVLSGEDLSYTFSPDNRGVDDNLNSVAWSRDGGYLYAGGKDSKSYDGGWKRIIRRWSEGGRGAYADFPAADMTIMHIVPLKNNAIAYGAYDPSFGIIDEKGTKAVYRSPSIADYRDNLEGFLISRDGSEVRFGYEVWGESPARFSIIDRTLKSGEGNGLKPPITSYNGIEVIDWKYSYTPKLNGRELKLKQYEMSRSLAISPDGSGFLLGADWTLRSFDRYGSERWSVPSPDVVWGVNVSGDGRVGVAAFGDGTIRWYRMEDGKELLAFFPHNDRKRWVLWSPSGYYDASAGADELIGWHINNGKDASADFFPASRFRSAFYRPDVVAKMLDTLDEGEALRLANEESGKKLPIMKASALIEATLPPVVSIISPSDNSEVLSVDVVIRYSVRTPSGEAVTGVKALIDGRPVSATRGVHIAPKDKDVREIRITVPEQDSEVSIIAENKYSASEPATIRLKWKGKKQDEFVIKPKLYVLAVGVSKYQDDKMSLKYAAKDAKDFADAMMRQKGPLYRDVTVKLLTNEQATRDEFMDGLDWIRRETTARDIAMIFFAGHGVDDQAGVFYYLPYNANPEKLMRTGVVYTDVKTALSTISGKALLFVDTCHSGDLMGGRRAVADITAVINELASAENGTVVFASSTGRQYSLENDAWNNGAFTKALVEGLDGKADLLGKGKITVNTLDAYIADRVKELTGGRQSPTTTKPHTISDFPVAVKR